MLRRLNQDLMKSFQSDQDDEQENPIKLDLTDRGVVHQCL